MQSLGSVISSAFPSLYAMTGRPSGGGGGGSSACASAPASEASCVGAEDGLAAWDSFLGSVRQPITAQERHAKLRKRNLFFIDDNLSTSFYNVTCLSVRTQVLLKTRESPFQKTRLGNPSRKVSDAKGIWQKRLQKQLIYSM